MTQRFYPTGPDAVENDPCSASGAGYVVGIDIGATNFRVALADTSGAMVAKVSASTVGTSNPELVVRRILDAIDGLLREKAISRAALRAVAAGAPGVTDVNAGIVLATSYLMGWRDVPLRAMLESALGVPAAVDNDVNLAALGESWAGVARGERDFVFLAVGTGVGAGIVLNGALFHSANWTAGEIGYMLVPGADEEPVGRGEPGALEQMVGGEGIRDQWLRAWSREKTSLPKDLTATRIFDHAVAGDGDPMARHILRHSAQALGYAIYNMFVTLSCPLFVLGGSVGLHPAFCSAVQAVLEQRKDRSFPLVRPSAFGPDAQLMGAVHLALKTVEAEQNR